MDEDTLFPKKVAAGGPSVAGIFFDHGGLQYLPTEELLSTVGSADRESRERARQEFADRLRRCHPSLAAAAGPGNVNGISWRDWRRFELGETESRARGERWRVTASDLEGIDVLLEVKKSDGSLVWHGCRPLQRGIITDHPRCDFTVPHISFDAARPGVDDYDKFESPDPRFPGLTTYHYWTGRSDCSLQQRIICKAMYGINVEPLLHVHVVLRRRSNGKMVTLISTSEPNQILGEDYGEHVGSYDLCYCNRGTMLDDDERVDAEISFSLYCSDTVGGYQQYVRFGTQDHSGEEDEYATVTFDFKICDEDNDEDSEGMVLWAMSAWKWD